MVKVTISLIILSGRSYEGSRLSLWVFVGGFIRSRLAGCVHTVLVTIPSHICYYGLLGLFLNHLVVEFCTLGGVPHVFVTSLAHVGWTLHFVPCTFV
jgi:hypothetical protein